MAYRYLSTKDLCERYRCSSRTIFRKMKRADNPFPAPCMKQMGACNLWDAAEISKWDEREIKRCKILA